MYRYMCASGDKKCYLFGKFCVRTKFNDPKLGVSDYEICHEKLLKISKDYTTFLSYKTKLRLEFMRRWKISIIVTFLWNLISRKSKRLHLKEKSNLKLAQLHKASLCTKGVRKTPVNMKAQGMSGPVHEKKQVNGRYEKCAIT